MTYSEHAHLQHDLTLLQRVVPILAMLGWEVRTELPGCGPADALATRDDRRCWLQLKTRAHENVKSPSVTITAEHFESYVRLERESSIPVIIISDDLRCDELTYVRTNAELFFMGGYFFCDTRGNARTNPCRAPWRHTLQDFFA